VGVVNHGVECLKAQVEVRHILQGSDILKPTITCHLILLVDLDWHIRRLRKCRMQHILHVSDIILPFCHFAASRIREVGMH
jgi:hypothetical protein